MPSYKATATRSRSLTTACGCTFGSRSASVRSRNSCSNAVSRSATKRSDAGAPNSGRPTPAGCADAAHGPVTNGTATKCSSGSTARSTTCGARSTSTATYSTSWSSPAETRWPPNDSSARCSKNLEYVPRVIVTDKLGSYQVAHRELLASVEHRRSKYLNNRIENSHQPTRQRERAMKRFTSPGHAQRFLSAFSGISPHFRPGRHRLTAPEWRAEMADRFTVWPEVTATVIA